MPKKSSTSEELFILETLEDLQHYLLKIVQQTRRDCLIFSRKLNPKLFNHENIHDAFSKLARSSNLAQIKILVADPTALVECNHQLLQLSQRLPSKIRIQKIQFEPEKDYEFIIADKDKLWLQHSEDTYTGFANFDAKPEVKRFTTEFNDLWKNSDESPYLRQLNL
jgi:hypothetical protein